LPQEIGLQVLATGDVSAHFFLAYVCHIARVKLDWFGKSMSLSIDEIRKIAFLARLDLSQQEAIALAPQFQQVLTFVEQLNQLDTTGVEPMTTALDVINCWSDDSIQGSLSRQDALLNAPASDGECFLVPPVLGLASSN
jgi:aspartyl-tRNA(Asn)/glutamyl-tRNA(Gln) amidotransferase subunit C